MKNIMKRAWQIARNAVAKFGGKVKEYFAQSLKMAWSEFKSVVSPVNKEEKVMVDKRLTFEKVESEFKKINKNGFISKEGNSKYIVCFDYNEDKIKTTYIAKYNNVKETDYNKYYTYRDDLLGLARKLKLDTLVSQYENNKIYTTKVIPDKTAEEIAKEDADFNELFGF